MLPVVGGALRALGAAASRAGASAGTAARSHAGTAAGALKREGNLASRALSNAWNAQASLDLFTGMVTAAWAHAPQFAHAINVTVSGGPNADLRRCWYLACAVAFGRMKRSPAVRGGSASMEGIWNVSDKSVQIQLVYVAAKMQYSEDAERPSATVRRLATWLEKTIPAVVNPVPVIVAGAFVRATKPAPGALSPKDSPLSLIQMGPDQISVGGAWPEFLLRHDQRDRTRHLVGGRPPGSVLYDPRPVTNPYVITPLFRVNRTGVNFGNLFREWPRGAGGQPNFAPYQLVQVAGRETPNFAGSPIARGSPPALPDSGRLVTTGEKRHVLVQSPRPCIDGATRSSMLSLIAAELESPCFLPPLAPEGFVPLHNTGYQLYPAGADPTYAQISDAANAAPIAVGANDVDPDGLHMPPTGNFDQRRK